MPLQGKIPQLKRFYYFAHHVKKFYKIKITR